jgi:tRNA(Arg) A34 adenosine deaminase TadA
MCNIFNDGTVPDVLFGDTLARIGAIVYGTSIGDVKRLGFNEMPISNAAMRRLGRSKVGVFPRLLREECLSVLEKWKSCKGNSTY